MQKLVFFPVLLIAACVVAAAYGAIHNQISYTVSPEFFHLGLFDRCMIPDGLRNRAGASLVGVFTTWWMGLVTGTPVMLLGLILPGWKAYVKHSLFAVVLVVTTAMVVGLIGLSAGFLVVNVSNAPTYLGVAPEDAVWMCRASLMHTCGYLGGVVGLFLAVVYLIVMRWGRTVPNVVRVRLGRARA